MYAVEGLRNLQLPCQSIDGDEDYGRNGDDEGIDAGWSKVEAYALTPAGYALPHERGAYRAAIQDATATLITLGIDHYLLVFKLIPRLRDSTGFSR